MTGHDKWFWRVRTRVVAAVALLFPFGSFCAQAAPAAAGLIGLTAVGQADEGTIKGRLVWGGETIPPVVNLVAKGQAPKDPNVCATAQAIRSHALEIDPKTKGVAYGFAYLSRPKAKNPAMVARLIQSRPSVEMDQKNCDFVPHSLALHQDQILLMKSSDLVGHNVRLTGFTNPGINQVVAPNGEIRVNLVAERLPLKIACDIHPWMTGYVMVFDHPFFAVTGADGSFELKGVPTGDFKLVVWQETVGYVTPGKGMGAPVTVRGGETTDVGEITLPAKSQ